MERIGFSTGALAKGDVERGLQLQRAHARGAVELSALREAELPRLVELARDLDLSQFEIVSVHLPSSTDRLDQEALLELINRLPTEWLLVVHPTIVNDLRLWRPLGARVCIENMDQRKDMCRTAEELEPTMEALPDARFCLDVAHAGQIDPSMAEAVSMLVRFGDRLAELHVSRLGPSSEHLPLDQQMVERIRKIADLVPVHIPLIIESVVSPDEVAREIDRVAEAFGR